MGHEPSEGRVVTGDAGARKRRRLGSEERGSPWGHGTCERCAVMRGAGARRGRQWSYRWSPLRGHEPRERCALLGGAGAGIRRHWGLTWTSLWGRGPCEVCAVMNGAGACARRHWGLRRRSLWGHEHCDRRAVMSGASACKHRRWCRTGSSLRGHERRAGALSWAARAYVNAAAEAFGGAPYGALAHVTSPLRSWVELPMTARNV